MKKLLALETASRWCSVALLQEGEAPRERFQEAPREQTALILPMVDELLAEAGWQLSDLDAVAYAQGPGAFTGVRVANSVAQGLAFSANLPVVGVSSLASCALAASLSMGGEYWLAAFDARMGQVYLGGYQVLGTEVRSLVPDCLCDPDSPPALPDAPWRGAGDGGAVAGLVEAAGLGSWSDQVAPRAATVAQLAMPKLLAGDTLSAEEAVPVYLRNQVIQGAIR